jgi:DNA-binding HxlR family transcriptional regulator
MPTPAKHRSACPLNAALEVYGDRWTLLIVRDLMFKDKAGYSEFLASEEGISTNILADRLRALEAEGIIAGQRDPENRRKIVYHLTAKGIDLAPVLTELIIWGARHAETDAPPEVIREMEENREDFLRKGRARLEAVARD